jgi:hypothetical protein
MQSIHDSALNNDHLLHQDDRIFDPDDDDVDDFYFNDNLDEDFDDEEDERTYINARGYEQDDEGNVLIDGEWMDPQEAQAEYEYDDAIDGLLLNDE